MAVPVSEAMGLYFERYRAAWRAHFEDEPWVAREPEVSPGFYGGEVPGQAGAVYWAPKRQEDSGFARRIQERFGGPLHGELLEYLSAYWFAELRGKLGNRRIQLTPVLPGLSRLEERIETYRLNRQGGQRYVAIGTEARTNGLVVVDNASGEVCLDDWELEKLEPLAPSLGELFSRFEP